MDFVSDVVLSAFKDSPEFLVPGTKTESARNTARETLAWVAECREFIQKVCSSSTANIVEVHERIFIADVLGWTRCDPRKASAGFKIFHHSLSEIATKGTSISGKEYFDLIGYHRAVGAACFGRKLFSTRNGRVGLEPVRSQPGDMIVLIPNSPWPFLFRRKADSGCTEVQERPTCEYIGDAYIHGIMDGELMRDIETDRITEFVLE